jgi:hypothetical protein
MRTLFEKNNVLRELFTATLEEGVCVHIGDRLILDVGRPAGNGCVLVVDQRGRRVGVIGGESGRALNDFLEKNGLSVAPSKVVELLAVTNDARIQVQSE